MKLSEPLIFVLGGLFVAGVVFSLTAGAAAYDGDDDDDDFQPIAKVRIIQTGGQGGVTRVCDTETGNLLYIWQSTRTRSSFDSSRQVGGMAVVPGGCQKVH